LKAYLESIKFAKKNPKLAWVTERQLGRKNDKPPKNGWLQNGYIWREDQTTGA
jgi:hypothetical protein